MIKDGIIKQGDVIFVYSQPPETALVGVVRGIQYPLLTVRAINRHSEKTLASEKTIDIMKEKALTILDKDKIKRFLSGKERKQLNKVKKELDEVVNDIFR
jgi:hypothetical protein